MSDTQQPGVLILGARGRFGQAAARAFARAGWRVLGQVRPGAMPEPVCGVDWLLQELHDSAALARSCGGVQVVLHALNPPYTDRQWCAQAPVLMEAAIHVSQLLRATLMLPGNVYNFGASMPSILSEDTAQRPSTVKGSVRARLEQRLAEATRDGAMRAVVLRAGDFFGSGSGSWFDRVMVTGLKNGKFTYPGNAATRTPWAYLPDLADAFVKVAQQRQRLPAFASLHFAGHHLNAQDWLGVFNPVAMEHGWLTPGGQLQLGSLPWPLLRFGGLLLPTWGALTEMRYLFQTPHALANDRLRALIGEEPHTPLPQAARAALAELGLIRDRSADAASSGLTPPRHGTAPAGAQ